MLVRLDMHAILGKPLKTATDGKKIDITYVKWNRRKGNTVSRRIFFFIAPLLTPMS